VPGLSSCKACPAGFFAEGNRTTNCTGCPAGRSQGASGQASCDKCEAGKYVAEKKSSYCLSCADGYKSTEGRASCSLCVAGFYWGVAKQQVADIPYEWGCQKCPANAVCAEGVKEGDLFQPVANPG